MKSGISKMFENREDLENIEMKSGNLKDTANKFKLTS
jgi:hypothetical protein